MVFYREDLPAFSELLDEMKRFTQLSTAFSCSDELMTLPLLELPRERAADFGPSDLLVETEHGNKMEIVLDLVGVTSGE